MKRAIVALVGGTLLAIGLAAAGLVGIAFVLVPGGLAILAMELGRARRWLSTTRKRIL